jgi:arachidonate 15-lipoxygenase
VNEILEEEAELRATLPTITLGGRQFWIAQGDLRLDEVSLRQLAAERVAARQDPPPPVPSELVGNRTPDGKMRRWTRGSTLTYSVHRHTFDTELDYLRVVGAVAGAAAEWAAITGLRFVHRVELDAQGVLPPQVTFLVQQRELFSFIALAFFPGDAPETRLLSIDPSWFSTRYDQTGVLRHELGHVLGFRHEHLRGAPAGCRNGEVLGDLTPLTDYDPRSAMHYPCGPLGTTGFQLTELDRQGARKVYLDEDEDPEGYEDHDPSPQERQLAPQAGLAGWQYTQDLLPGVPMLDTRASGLPRDQRPRLGWFVRVAEVALALAANRRAEAPPEDPPGDPTAEAQIEAFLAAHGDPTDELPAQAPEGPEVLRVAWALARQGLTDPLAVLRQVLRDTPRAAASAPTPTLAHYQGLSAARGVPRGFEQFPLSDDSLAEMRVAGFTPMALRRVDAPPFPLTDAQLAAVTVAGDTLARALAERRLYACDYADVGLPPLAPSTVPYGPKFGFAPTLLLALPPGVGLRRLRPVAIRLDPASPRVTLPSDPTWGWHKLAVQQADASRHTLVDHLARTHLLLEPVALATRRCLPEPHPVARLLWPHLEGTLSINDAAVTGLLGEGKPIDQALAGTIASARAVIAGARLGQPFDRYAPPVELAARDVMDPDLHYPYRDDALLLWQAISAWTEAYVSHTTPSDEAVAADAALERWRAELADPALGAVAAFGQDSGPFTTRAGLAHALAILVFVASAQHAALSSPQEGLMRYAPGVPGALYTPHVPPDLVSTLPPLDLAQLQLESLSLLGGVRYTRLGHYRDGALPAEVLPALLAFRQALEAAELTITARNQARPLPYPYLLPSGIPQSIHT